MSDYCLRFGHCHGGKGLYADYVSVLTVFPGRTYAEMNIGDIQFLCALQDFLKNIYYRVHFALS
jgi:hypothetical protein